MTPTEMLSIGGMMSTFATLFLVWNLNLKIRRLESSPGFRVQALDAFERQRDLNRQVVADLERAEERLEMLEARLGKGPYR